MTVENAEIGGVPVAVARPDGPPAGGIVVLQEAFGLTGHIESICRRLAAAGYLAVAPALFHRNGSPVLPYDRFDLAGPLLAGLDVSGFDPDIAACLDLLHDAGVADSGIGVVGFCMGGSIALYEATRLSIGASVSFYGGGVSTPRFGLPPLQELAPQIRIPWLGLYGEQDPTIPIEDIDALRDAVARADAPTELVTYPEAGHGFNCDERATFVPAAAADAWARMLRFLGDRLAG